MSAGCNCGPSVVPKVSLGANVMRRSICDLGILVGIGRQSRRHIPLIRAPSRGSSAVTAVLRCAAMHLGNFDGFLFGWQRPIPATASPLSSAMETNAIVTGTAEFLVYRGIAVDKVSVYPVVHLLYSIASTTWANLVAAWATACDIHMVGAGYNGCRTGSPSTDTTRQSSNAIVQLNPIPKMV